MNELSLLKQYVKSVFFVNLRAYEFSEIKNRLSSADVIYIVGGAQLVLPRLFILPHYEREDHPRRTEAILTPLLQDNPFPLFGVTDAQAVVSDNGTITFVGGEPVKFGKEK